MMKNVPTSSVFWGHFWAFFGSWQMPIFPPKQCLAYWLLRGVLHDVLMIWAYLGQLVKNLWCNSKKN